MLEKFLLPLIEDLIRGLSGTLGIRLRRFYYQKKLKQCGARLTIETGVHIVSASSISIGEDVWLDKNSLLIAGPIKESNHVKVLSNKNVKINAGEISIGSGSHIGIGVIIQGHGGVEIAEAFTAAPHSKIYSLSNDHRKCYDGTIQNVAGNSMPHYILAPVSIGRNVWIGLSSVVLGHSVGSNCFIRPGSLVLKDIPNNSIFGVSHNNSLEERFP